MELLIVFIIFIVLWLLIEIFSIILKMTGLDLYKARFQIISIITHTGFTTRESELITQHPLRRRIANILMVASYVTQASLISVFFNILSKNKQQLGYLILLLFILVLFIFIITRTKYITSRFNRFVERMLARSIMKQKKRSIDQVLKVSAEFGVYEIVLDDSNSLCDKALKNTNLKENMIQVLKVDRGSKIFDFPHAELVLHSGDRLVLYGKTQEIIKMKINRGF